MTKQTKLGGNFTLPGTPIKLLRMGYGAMQLAGPEIGASTRCGCCDCCPARGHCIRRQPYRYQRLLRPACDQSNYQEGSSSISGDLVIVTKLGARRGEDKSWLHALSRQELIDGAHDNLRNLGVDALDVVNLRVGGMMEPSEGSIEEPLTVLAELKAQGLIRHIGLSNVSPQQLQEAQKITEIVCIQNFYNVAHRNDDAWIDALAKKGIAYVPFFPLGGFTPLQSSVLDRVAASMEATPMQVALAWLLQRSPNILMIPGTSSLNHLRDNLGAAAIELPPDVIAELNTIAETVRAASQSTH